MKIYRLSVYTVKNSIDGQLIKLAEIDAAGIKSVLSINGKEKILPYYINETDFLAECNNEKLDWEHKEDIYLNEESLKALLTV